MSIRHFTMRAAVLLFPLFCVEPFLAQEKARHACFEQPNGAKEAIRRLPENARNWLAEDAIYIITPEERCAFLRLDSDEEREQFIEQFWYRRSVEPISLDYDFKTEFYRRFVVANEKYGRKLLAGWKTDRGRLYVIFGPPDSVDENPNPAAPHSIETWNYHYIKGIGEEVQIHFEYSTRHDDYVLRDADRDLVGQAEPNPDPFPVTPENMGLHIGPEQPPQIRFKDLEALLVTRMVRNEVKFSQQIEYSAATHATTLARIDIHIPCGTCTRDSQTAAKYPLFVRISKPSGWVVATSELVADIVTHDESDSKLTLAAHLDVPVAPGTYQLALATKNATTGDAGVLRTQINVPTYELLEMKSGVPLSADSTPKHGQARCGLEMLTDPAGIDFNSYLRTVYISVRQNWYAVMPPSVEAGQQGINKVEFRVMQDGKIPEDSVKLTAQSGKEELDRASLVAIRAVAAAPFSHLPEKFSQPFIALRITFLYNMASEKYQNQRPFRKASNGSVGR